MFNELDIFDENFKQQLNELLNDDLWRDSFRDKFVDLFIEFFFRNCDSYSERTRDKIFKHMCNILHEKLYPNETTGTIVNLRTTRAKVDQVCPLKTFIPLISLNLIIFFTILLK